MTIKAKKTLTAAQLAAIAAGAVVVDTSPAPQAAAGGEDDATQAQADQAAAAEAVVAAAQAEVDATAVQAAADAAIAAAAAVAAAPQAESDLVKFLRAELASRDEKLTANAIKLSALEGQMAEATATLPALLAIARASVTNMQVALGGRGTAEAMTPVQIVTAHAETLTLFSKKFKVGGVASAGATDTAVNEPATSPQKANVFALASRVAAK